MAEAYTVKVDLVKLASNLSAAEKTTVTPDDCMKTLTENGFIFTGDGWWTCEDISMDFLAPEEILDVKTLT